MKSAAEGYPTKEACFRAEAKKKRDKKRKAEKAEMAEAWREAKAQEAKKIEMLQQEVQRSAHDRKPYEEYTHEDAWENIENNLAAQKNEWMLKYAGWLRQQSNAAGSSTVLLPQTYSADHDELVPIHRPDAPSGLTVDSGGPMQMEMASEAISSEETCTFPTPLPGCLRSDHAVSCTCCCGVSTESLLHAAPPRTRTGTAYRPAAALESFVLTAEGVDERLIYDVRAEVQREQYDDQMVYENGCGPGRVHLLQTDYPSCLRSASALCEGGLLRSYGAGEYQVPEYEVMRPMSLAKYKLGVAWWRAAWHNLSPACQVPHHVPDGHI